MTATIYIVTFQFNEISNNGKEKDRIITDQFSKIFTFKCQAEEYANKKNEEYKKGNNSANGEFKIFKIKINNAWN